MQTLGKIRAMEFLIDVFLSLSVCVCVCVCVCVELEKSSCNQQLSGLYTAAALALSLSTMSLLLCRH